MAAKKKKARRKGRRAARPPRRVYRRRFVPHNEEQRRYMVWTHDFDTVIHGMVRNPAAIKMAAAAFVEKAAGIAEEMRKLQDGKRPKGVDSWR